jgi:hypothetical protein
MKITYPLLILGLFIWFTVGVTSCVKNDFDEPEITGHDPEIAEEDIISFEAVLDLFITGQFVKINMDKYVKGIVVADDASGTFYKTLVIEDENSDLGITILIDENNLAAKFPIGRRVYIDLSDLWISDYNNLPQLGYGPYIDDRGDEAMSSVPGALAETVLLRGDYGLEVVPTPVSSMTLLGTSKLNTLIRLENVQFSAEDAGGMWADADNEISFNMTLEDCSENTITVRSSAFSTFASEIVTTGKGSLTAVYSIFGETKQLLVRSLDDVDLTGDRCDGSGGITGERISVSEVRALFNGTPVNGPEGYIEGVVISDYTNGNITGRNLVVQDGNSGIVVRFTENHSYEIGEKIQVSTTGIEISEFNGLLQLNNVPPLSSVSIGTGEVTPNIISLGDVLQDFENYESTLVTIENPTISGGSTFADDLTLSDNSGSMLLFTRSGASFANTSVPANLMSVTGIIGEYTTSTFNPQLSMRNLDDIDGEGTTGNDDGINEEFNGGSDDSDIEINNWENVVIQGTRKWQKKTFDGNGYAQATAFNDSNPAMETWLVSPAVDATMFSQLSFETAQAFYAHDGLTVWVTSDYTGDVTTTNWESIDAELAGSSSDDHDWVPSGSIDISAYGNKARIAFKYEGNGASNTTSYRIDNVQVK